MLRRPLKPEPVPLSPKRSQTKHSDRSAAAVCGGQPWERQRGPGPGGRAGGRRASNEVEGGLQLPGRGHRGEAAGSRRCAEQPRRSAQAAMRPQSAHTSAGGAGWGPMGDRSAQRGHTPKGQYVATKCINGEGRQATNPRRQVGLGFRRALMNLRAFLSRWSGSTYLRPKPTATDSARARR